MPSAQPRVVPWTPEEDERLASAVASCGSKFCWKKIAASMSGRNNQSCRKRWLHSLDPNLRKGRWTSEEDAALIESVAKYGKRWYEVARALPGRTDDQCAKRYKEAVDPSIRRDPWTSEEDEQLWSTFKKHGNKWHTIASLLRGRPPIHCRNRLQSLQRIMAAADEMAGPSTGEPPKCPHNLPSPTPSTSNLSSTSPPSPLTPSSPTTHLPGEGPFQINPSATPAVPVYDGERDYQSGLEVSPEVPQNENFHVSPQVLQHGFWKDSSAGISMTGQSVQLYPQVLISHMDPTAPFNNSSSYPLIPFIMTCPVPHCCYQCQSVVEIWRHITWTHVRPQSDDGTEGIVEKVILGNI